MLHGLIAKKVGMSRVFLSTGEAVAVTYLAVEPNVVIRTKTAERDGYNAIVLGVRPRKWKTRKGNEHTRYGWQKEWRVESLDGLQIGTELTAATMPIDTNVTITGVSKGKGFQGTMRRHNFAGGPGSHGSHLHRKPGSVGMREWPGRVLKGKRMAGHMGIETVTLKHRAVLGCDVEKGIIAVRGPVPGPSGSAVYLTPESSS